MCIDGSVGLVVPTGNRAGLAETAAGLLALYTSASVITGACGCV